MRDPAALLQVEAGAIVRLLREPADAGHFLHSAIAREWVARGDLVPYEWRDDKTVAAERVPFVTHPYEWTDNQFFEAGRLTLKLHAEAAAHGFDLKDASAWNIIFIGTRPVFCDLLSFEPLNRRRWWAAGQFARHFILPLLISKRKSVQARECFLVWRDGVPHSVARTLIGPARYLSRYWPLMSTIRDGVSHAEDAEYTYAEISTFRKNLGSSLDWMLNGVQPASSAALKTLWSNYTTKRDHYTDDDIQAKRRLVHDWVRSVAPRWTLDLGCNSGEFSRIALEAGSNVIALDGDHGAITGMLVKSVESKLYPVVSQLDDLQGGRGWNGTEHTSLDTRLSGRSDLVMMLALIHHLTISASLPVEAIATTISRWCRRWAIVEFLSSDDPQVRALCAQRNRSPDEFSLASQRAAFTQAGFILRHESSIPSGHRTLALLEKSTHD